MGGADEPVEVVQGVRGEGHELGEPIFLEVGFGDKGSLDQGEIGDEEESPDAAGDGEAAGGAPGAAVKFEGEDCDAATGEDEGGGEGESEGDGAGEGEDGEGVGFPVASVAAPHEPEDEGAEKGVGGVGFDVDGPFDEPGFGGGEEKAEERGEGAEHFLEQEEEDGEQGDATEEGEEAGGEFAKAEDFCDGFFEP